MKKILLFAVMLIAAVSVDASTGSSKKDIDIENIKIELKEDIGYNEELNVKYTINPSDASNTTLNWDVTGTKKDVTVEFLTNKETDDATGEVVIKINNATENEVELKLIAKQNGNTISTTVLNVEAKEATIERVTGEVEDLIKNLDEKIKRKNYEENKEAVDSIKKSLESNKEVEELLDEELLEKYDTVSDLVVDYESKSGNTTTIIISVVLVALFILGMFLIFRKEDK